MKKNYFLRAAGALLLASVLMLGGVSGTVARFTDGALAANQAVRVAAFRVLFNNEVLGLENDGEIVVNLFDTLFSSVDGIVESGDFSVNQVNQVVADDAPEKTIPIIAPGNGGQIVVGVENLSEVPIKYHVVIDTDSLQNDFDIPVEFRVKDGAIWSEWKPAIDAPVTGTGKLGMIAGTDNKYGEILVQWRWVYELGANPNQIDNARNIKDSGLGIGGQAYFSGDEDPKMLSVTVKATASQID